MDYDNEHTIVISDLLSFLSCKIKFAPKDKLLQVLRKFYSEKDINEAHRTLLASIPKTKSNEKHNDLLNAMYDCFQMIPESDLPVFVCKNLNNIPELDSPSSGVKPELQDYEEDDTVDDDSEQYMETVVEEKLQEEQKAMKSQIADIVVAVNELKRQFNKISQKVMPQNNSVKTYGTSFKRKAVNNCSNDDNKKLALTDSNSIKSTIIPCVKKNGLAYLQSLIDEDELKSDLDQSENDDNTSFEEGFNFSDTELEYSDENHDFKSISCEVILTEESENQGLLSLNKTSRRKNENRPSYLSSSNYTERSARLQRDFDSSPSKKVGRKVIYIKNEDGRRDDEEISIEIHPSMNNFEDSSSRISFDLPAEEEDFKGEVELRFNEVAPSYNPRYYHDPKVCSICGELFSTQKKLDSHVKAHCVRKMFDCILCDEGFHNEEHLKIHFEICLEVTKKKFNLTAHPCQICGRLYSKERALKQHSYMHSESRPFPCNQCTYRYLTKNSLDAHVKTQHNILNKFFCPFCDNSYINAGFLKNHIRSHTGERPYACSECGYKAATPDLLKRHLLTHGPPKEYKCDACDFSCLGIGKMSRHKAKEHKREHIFCAICGKEFNNSCVYNKHYMSHIGARPFSCSVCSYSAISKEVLVVHMRTHTGDNIINCPKCAVPFGTKYSLKRHLKSYCTGVGTNKSNFYNTEFTEESAV